jgi:hypothetical protein
MFQFEVGDSLESKSMNSKRRGSGFLSVGLFAFVAILSVEVVINCQERGRIAPPPDLKCDRSDLTSYDGRVLTYRRRRGSTFLRIRTNFDTTEVVTLQHPRTDDPSQFYLLNGEPFTGSDWRLIERRKYVLRPNMRANVWVCRGNPAIQPIVDWRPEDTGANPRAR